jgi:hypothetical protein
MKIFVISAMEVSSLQAAATLPPGERAPPTPGALAPGGRGKNQVPTTRQSFCKNQNIKEEEIYKIVNNKKIKILLYICI